MMRLLDRRVVLVNGATAGLGAGVGPAGGRGGGMARAAVREGGTVAITGRRRELGEPMAAELGAMYVQADMSDVAAVRAAVGAVIDANGRVDCLVNSAGLTSRGTLLDTT